MEKFLKYTFAIFLLLILKVIYQDVNSIKEYVNPKDASEDRINEAVDESKKVNKANFILALAYVESKWDEKAYNKSTDAAGYLQIRKSVVDDCNRIIGRELYTLKDRLDKKKSIEMFMIIQNHYNKDFDIHYALKIWNPKASFSYHAKVMNKYNELNIGL